MPPSFQLPPWLQIVVAASAVISSFGVIVALFQIAIAKGQFKTQLATTSAQFTLLNQGYLYLDTRSSLYSPQLVPNTPMKPGISYESIGLEATLENVGNTPITYSPVFCIIYFNGVQVYEAPMAGIGPSVCYPKQRSQFGFGTVAFNSTSSLLTIPQIQALNITCKFKFIYKDFNSNHRKTIERTLVMRQEDYRTSGTYSEINDTL